MASKNALMVQGSADSPIPIPISGTATVTPDPSAVWVVSGSVTAIPSGTYTVSGTVGVSGTVTVQPAAATTWTVAGTVTTVPSGTQTVTGTVSVGNTVTVTPAAATTWTTSVSNTVTVQPAAATTWTVSGTVAVSGTTTVQITPTVTAADNLANPTAPQAITHPHLWDSGGAQWRRQQSATNGPLLSLTARTANAQSGTKVNTNAPRLVLSLHVTVASGTGGLTLSLRTTNPTDANTYILWIAAAAVTATGEYEYTFGPGVTYAPGLGTPRVAEAIATMVPDNWFAFVSVGDASSYTYSLSYRYCP